MGNYIKYRDLINRVDIKSGDIILISSDVFRLMYVALKNKDEFDANVFIDSIIDKVGDQGTILFPTYNWGFCKGETFDYNNTKSATGYLSEVALKRSDFKRTQHPIYSFAVWGKLQDEFMALDNISSFAEDSPFGLLNRRHAKELFIDVDLTHSFTYVIYVAQMCGVNYRYEKTFKADYIDVKGTKTEREYSMYVRDLDLNVVANYTPLEHDLEERGVLARKYINNIPFLIVDLHRSVEVIKEDIIYNNSRNFCTFKGQ